MTGWPHKSKKFTFDKKKAIVNKEKKCDKRQIALNDYNVFFDIL